MASNAFLLCPDGFVSELVGQELSRRGVPVEHASDFMQAFDRLAEQAFDLIIVDTSDSERALLVIHSARTGTVNARAFIVALAEPGAPGTRHFRDTGANMLLFKPLNAERLSTSLDNALAAMKHERRISSRMPLTMTISVSLDGQRELAAELEDCSEGGMAVRTSEPLPPGGPLKLSFRLPHHADLQEVSGEVVWKDLSGRFGIRFTDLNENTRRLIAECLRPLGG
jgi:response regulator RpfG family c-di-GMP phosphodiesterase